MAVTNLANTDLVSNRAGSKKEPATGAGRFGGCIVRNYSRARSKCVLFARLTQAKHDFKSPDALQHRRDRGDIYLSPPHYVPVVRKSIEQSHGRSLRT